MLVEKGADVNAQGGVYRNALYALNNTLVKSLSISPTSSVWHPVGQQPFVAPRPLRWLGLQGAGDSEASPYEVAERRVADVRNEELAGDDGGEEEFPVEEICGDRKLDDGGLELLVRWKSGEETWEPYENVAETKALAPWELLGDLDPRNAERRGSPVQRWLSLPLLVPSELEEKQRDHYRGVRTVVVLLWMITNFALCAVMLSSAGVEKIVPGEPGQSEAEIKA
ncbi:hypothetical protein NEMBOFW57_008141 [Staphylotrichum longicolle]|uniref:Chromo domain-containing protein n=1 Tax=Staphylotrichum longicolle TaxID=669026 RepID=A0AAD4EUK7_9PEZI|nr:hypothetical protein NEMBOFW57_008141 [Staphylotrichum longicolle]